MQKDSSWFSQQQSVAGGALTACIREDIDTGGNPHPLAKLPTMTNEEFIKELDQARNSEFTLDSLADFMHGAFLTSEEDHEEGLNRFKALAFHLWKQQN